MEDNIDTQLELAIGTIDTDYDADAELYTGYLPESGRWSLLIRYSGDITDLVKKYDVEIFYLLAGYAVINIRQSDIDEFAAYPGIIYVEKPKKLYSQISYSLYKSCMTESFYKKSGLTGKGVLVAIIDSGIDYKHKEFQNQEGSRIYELWDQSAEYNPENANIYGLGRIYSQKEIDDSIQSGEDITTSDISGHGTAVAAIAAGTGIGAAPDADILAVKIGSDRLGTSPNTLGLIMGIDYAVRTSMKLGMPLALNISFGNNYGAHTGKSFLESYIDDISRLTRCVIVTGTGNDGLSGRHFQGTLGNVSYSDVEILVGAYVSSFNIQIWKNYQDIFEVFLVAPNGETVLYLNEGNGIVTSSYGSTRLEAIYGTPNPYNRSQEIFINLYNPGSYVSSGIWHLMLYPKSIVDGRYDIYLPVADSTSGKVEFLISSEFGTLTIPATLDSLISVAAYDANNDTPAFFSGRGYTADGRIKPDIAAPGTDIYTAVPGNSYSFVSGTSFAAPFVTGGAALLMEWGLIKGNDSFLYGERLKAALIRGAGALPGIYEYPNPYLGWGVLCISGSFPD